MAKLQFHREKNMLMDWLMLNEMTTGEIVLWHTLMNIGNRLGQRRVFNAPASTLMKLTGLSRRSMERARTKLVERGIVRYQQGSVTKAPVYEMVPITEALDIYIYSWVSHETRNDAQEFPKDDAQTDAPHDAPHDAPNDHIHKEKDKERGGSVGQEFQSIFHTYEENINKLQPIVKRNLVQWLQKLGREIVEEAIQLTVKKGGRTFSYIETILKEWESHGLTTLEDVKRHEAEKELKKRKKLIPMRKIKTNDEQALLEWAREEFE